MKNSRWDARIRRAEELKSTYPFAVQGLGFYERVTAFQKALYANCEIQFEATERPRLSGILGDETDFLALLPQFPVLLAAVEQNAPFPLAQAARFLLQKREDEWAEMLSQFWSIPDSRADLKPAERLVSWIFLKPYAEYLADNTVRSPLNHMPSTCPLCGCPPAVGVLRPEGDGGKRSLICGLCSTEWDYRRIICPACGEEEVQKLAVYTAEEFRHLRVETCDTCHSYIKTVDLTKDGRAVPDVDEIATIPLNLWATEHGYKKLHINLLGL